MTHNEPKLDHIGVAVKDIATALRFWRDAFGLTFGGEEVLPERGLKIAFLNAGPGGIKIELLQGLGDDTISKFIMKRGEGLHHLCFQVDDLDGAVAALKKQGYEFTTEAPYAGAHGSRVIFLRPHGTTGVLVELKEMKP